MRFHAQRRGAASVLWAILPPLVLCACGSDPDDGAAPDAFTGTEPESGSASEAAELSEFDKESNAFARRLAQCLRKRGWDAETFPAGGDQLGVRAAGNIPKNQQAAWHGDMMDCNESIGPPPTPDAPDEEHIRLFYAFLLEQRECLIAEGQQISEPPSEDVFVESFATGVYWTAWSEVDFDQAPSVIQALEETCPQEPPAGILFD